MMEYRKTSLEGLLLLHPQVFADERGYFSETYRSETLTAALGFTPNFVQENESGSSYGVLRGIHLQCGNAAQAKLVSCASGRVLDIAVDLRPSSPTFGRYEAFELNSENKARLFLPRGFGHAFLVLSSSAVFQYKVDNYYTPDAECCIRFDDPSLAIPWGDFLPASDLILSEKDCRGLSLKEASEQALLAL